ncbi:MAG TPA: aryl-sulfate sulfotransferase [Acidimicrobiia bacterium]|nr:aryl-sulfate sulfotransferase [Acidimicrobiia bacterium]
MTETSERTRTGRVIGVALVVVLALGVIALRSAGDSHATGPRGLVTNEDAAFAGYTLYSPLELQRALLVDIEGNVVHDWETTTQPGLFQYLLEDGHLLRAGDLEQEGAFAAGQGAGGRIEELDWDGNVVWQLDYADDNVMQHHDVEPLPNGNVLFVAWERKSGAEAIAAGRDPGLLPDDEMWPDTIIEYSPATDEVVWQWSAWDHLVQDQDPTKANYGDVADSPGKLDVNFILAGNDGDADWNHVNAVTYNADRDEVMISSRSFSEIWVVDHDTTTTEAAGPVGDIAFRFGNPRAYQQGEESDQTLFAQHDPRWIPEGSPGEGDITVFSNGLPEVRQFSSVEQIHPELAGDDYVLEDSEFAATIDRVYPTDEPDPYFAAIISGAQRLANGNTMFVYGTTGRIIEIDDAGEIVWEYQNPYYAIHDDTPNASGAGFDIEAWWTFRALRYAPSYPGVAELTTRN